VKSLLHEFGARGDIGAEGFELGAQVARSQAHDQATARQMRQGRCRLGCDERIAVGHHDGVHVQLELIGGRR
jgi:hypothetical protein